MDFRIARQARDRYGFEERLFSTDGEAIALDESQATALAERFVREPDALARAASEIAAIGLLHELAHRAVAVERRNDPRGGGPMARGLASLDGRIGQAPVDGGLVAFETAFPSLPVYRDELRGGRLAGAHEGRRARARGGPRGARPGVDRRAATRPPPPTASSSTTPAWRRSPSDGWSMPWPAPTCPPTTRTRTAPRPPAAS